MPTPPLHLKPAALDLGRKTIRLQLTLLVLAVILPTFFVSNWYLLAERDSARQVARDKVKILVDNAAERVNASLRVNADLLTLLSEQPQLRALNRDSCGSVIEDYVRLHPEYVNIGTRDMQGNPVCGYESRAAPREQMSSSAWFRESIRAGRFYAGDVFLAPLSQRWLTVLTMPIRNDAGSQVGLVVLPLDLSTFNKLLLQAVPDTAVVTVIDRNSDILLRSLEPDLWIGKPIAVDARTDKRTEGFATRASADGGRRVIAFRVLPDTGWRVASGVSETEVFAAADAALRNGVIGSVALLLAALALAWRLGLGFVRPLDALAATATRVAAGDVDARTPLNVGPRELELVARSFNHMLDVRKQADQALRQSEENLSITLQSIGDGVIATDAGGRVVRMNPVAERLTGWSLAAARGRRLNDVFRIVNASTRESSLDPVQRVLETGQVVGLANHTALLARDGSEYHISDSAAPIRNGSGQTVGVVLVFSDVSVQYRLQQEVVESESRYRALVESLPVGVAVHRGGTLTYVNPMAVQILGARSADELLGRQAIDFVHPDYRRPVMSRAEQLVVPGATRSMMEVQYVRVDGSVIDVQSQAITIMMHGESAVQISFMDITERKAAESTLRENEARFRALTELSSDWYWEQDAQFRFVRVDGNLAAVTGSPNDERVGKTRWELGEISLTAAEWDQHRAVLHAHQEFRDFHLHLRNLAGQEFWVSVSGAPMFDTRGAFRGYRGVGRDISAQKLAADQIHALAFYDALTELPNRRLLMEQLKKALLTHTRNHRQAALLFIDLDNFKTLNDTLGHETGDLLLRQVALRLLECVRESDSVARLGGDEFVVMVEDLSEDPLEAAVQAELVSHKILDAFGSPFELAGREHRSTPSIGVTLFGRSHTEVEELLKQADLAMYQAKAAGRNTVRIFDQGMQAAVDSRVAMENDLRLGLSRQQLLLHYQPVVQSDGRITGAEALVRWRHPVRGMVAPGAFITLAESTRLILPLGQWVLDTACAQLAVWARHPDTRHLTLAVNVSAYQFVEPDFVQHVLQTIDRSGADPRRLKLELTESLLADNMEDVILKMRALRDRGIDFSLDDFGTGYSSLSYLKRLPLAQLKIDQSFVRDLLVDPNDAAIARTIVALGASLGLAVIAEGVETQGQHQFLLDIGCSAFQGYLFGRPVAIGEFDALLPGKTGQP
jgi:diguanylate cyclase (GGDEF)-like protein/PAS domain S-box-containing protein